MVAMRESGTDGDEVVVPERHPMEFRRGFGSDLGSSAQRRVVKINRATQLRSDIAMLIDLGVVLLTGAPSVVVWTLGGVAGGGCYTAVGAEAALPRCPERAGLWIVAGLLLLALPIAAFCVLAGRSGRNVPTVGTRVTGTMVVDRRSGDAIGLGRAVLCWFIVVNELALFPILIVTHALGRRSLHDAWVSCRPMVRVLDPDVPAVTL